MCNSCASVCVWSKLLPPILELVLVAAVTAFNIVNPLNLTGGALTWMGIAQLIAVLFALHGLYELGGRLFLLIFDSREFMESLTIEQARWSLHEDFGNALAPAPIEGGVSQAIAPGSHPGCIHPMTTLRRATLRNTVTARRQ